MARGWLDAVLAGASGSTTVVSCHPATGALLHEQPSPHPRRTRSGRDRTHDTERTTGNHSSPNHSRNHRSANRPQRERPLTNR